MAVMRWLVRQRQQRYSICPKFIVVLFLASNFGCIFVDSSPRSRLLASNSNSTTRPYHQLVNDNYDDPEANKSSSIVEQQQRYYDEAIQVSSLEKYYCYDYRTDCYHRANVNSECITNPKWMHSHCPISCNVSCSEHIVQTVPIELSLHSNKTRKRTTIVDAVGNDLGMVPQIVPSNYLTDDTVYEKIDTILSNARTYMSKIQTQEKYQIVQSLCSNRNDTCIQLALDGKCEDDDESDDNDDIYNSTIMSRMCGPICQSCEELHVSLKCPLPHANEIRNGTYTHTSIRHSNPYFLKNESDCCSFFDAQ